MITLMTIGFQALKAAVADPAKLQRFDQRTG